VKESLVLPAGDAETQEIWRSISLWNAAIESEFFEGAGIRPVYLDFEEEVLARVAADAGSASEDPENELAALLAETLYWDQGEPPFLSQHLSQERSWRQQGRVGTPPFLAILALFSMVAEVMRSDGDYRSSNYYGRLCQVIGADPGSTSEKTKVSHGFMEGSPQLWSSLNEWIEQGAGVRGRPTAYAFDYRRYVSIPLSQALVREVDRHALPVLFRSFRLRPGQVISLADMERLLMEWAPHSPLSKGLRSMIEKGGEAAERVAGVACLELEAWDGMAGEGEALESRREAELRLEAILRAQPRARLDLGLGIEGGSELPDGPFKVTGTASEHLVAAFSATGGEVTPMPADVGGWRELAEAGAVSIPDLILGEAVLLNGEFALRRPARRLITMERDEERRRFVEVTRVQLGVTSMLLCHHSLAEEVDALLGEIARPGFQVHDPEALQGLPDDWLAYTDVMIMAVAEVKKLDLGPLVPLSWTQVSLGGGFALPGRLTWLRGMSPEVRASCATPEEVGLRLSCERPLAENAPEAGELARFDGAIAVSLPPMPDGDYRVAVVKGDADRVLASTLFRIRSAENPRLLPPDEDVRPSHCLGEPWGAISASVQVEGGETVQGAAVLGARASTIPSGNGILPPARLDLSALAFDPRELDPPVGSPRAVAGEIPGCMLTGAHYFLLADAPRNPGERSRPAFEGQCKLCGLERLFSPSPPRRHRGAGDLDLEHAPAALAADVAPVKAEPSVAWGTLIEAISYAQVGTWATFSALAGAVDDAPWFPLEAARLLSSLGHLDLCLDPRSLRPVGWSAAPTVIATIGDDRAVLVGVRSQRLLDRLDEDLGALGGRFDAGFSSDGVPVIRLHGLGPADLEAVAQSTTEATGLSVRTSLLPALEIAARLPTLDELVTALPTMARPPDLPSERFEPGDGTWVEAGDTDRPGAYRFRGRPVLHCFIACDHVIRIADNRLVKWLAAAESGASGLAYDGDAMELIVPLGMQLPGLYERAAVLAAGEAPRRHQDGSVRYGQVPAELAAALWRAVAPRGRATG
jgi:hypothetical protein